MAGGRGSPKSPAVHPKAQSSAHHRPTVPAPREQLPSSDALKPPPLPRSTGELPPLAGVIGSYAPAPGASSLPTRRPSNLPSTSRPTYRPSSLRRRSTAPPGEPSVLMVGASDALVSALEPPMTRRRVYMEQCDADDATEAVVAAAPESGRAVWGSGAGRRTSHSQGTLELTTNVGRSGGNPRGQCRARIATARVSSRSGCGDPPLGEHGRDRRAHRHIGERDPGARQRIPRGRRRGHAGGAHHGTRQGAPERDPVHPRPWELRIRRHSPGAFRRQDALGDHRRVRGARARARRDGGATAVRVRRTRGRDGLTPRCRRHRIAGGAGGCGWFADHPRG